MSQKAPKPQFTSLPRVCLEPGANSTTSLFPGPTASPSTPSPQPIATGRQWWAGPAFVRGVRPVNLGLGWGGPIVGTERRERGLLVGTDNRGPVRVGGRGRPWASGAKA